MEHMISTINYFSMKKRVHTADGFVVQRENLFSKDQYLNEHIRQIEHKGTTKKEEQLESNTNLELQSTNWRRSDHCQ